MGSAAAMQPASGAMVASELPRDSRGSQQGRAAAPKPPVTPPPGPQKLGTPRDGGASESGSGDDEYAARPGAAAEPAQDWSAAADWTPVNGVELYSFAPCDPGTQ